MKWNRIFACLLAFVLLVPAMAWADPVEVLPTDDMALDKSKLETHPRILLDGVERDSLRDKIKNDPAYKEYWEFVRDGVDNIIKLPPRDYVVDSDDGWMRDAVGNNLGNIAFAYMMTGEQKYMDAAEGLALKACSYPTWGRGSEENTSLMAGHILAGLGFFYDWCYEDLSEETRQTVRSTIIERGEAMYKASRDTKTFWSQEWLQNHMYIHTTGMVIAGTAIMDEYPAAEKWFDEANSKFKRTINLLPEDGSNHEGPMYWIYGTQFMLMYMDLAREFYNTDYYEVPWFKETAKFMEYTMFPEEYWTTNYNHFNLADDDYNYIEGVGPDHVIFKLAKENRDGNAQYFAEQTFEKRAHKPTMLWAYILWNDQSVEAVSPKGTMDEMQFFPDMGIVSARSGWQDNESMVLFKSGPYIGHKALEANNTANPVIDWGGGHAHPDAQHFSVFAEGDMQLVDDGYSHKYTNSHNSLLVDGKGQLGEGYVWFRYQDAQPVKSAPRVRTAVSQPTYDYMVGEAAQAYSSSMGLTKYDRHLLYIKPNILLVVDDIASAKPHNFELRFFPNTQQAIEQADGSYYVQNANSKLLAKNLAPDGGEFAAESVQLYSGKANTKSTTPSTASDHLAFRSTKQDAKSFVTATAFSWSDNTTTPPEVSCEQNGSIYTFTVMGEKYTLNIGTGEVTAPEKSDATQLLYNGKQLIADVDAVIENGAAYLPARQFTEAMHGRVSWDAEASQATVAIGKKSRSFAEGTDGVKLVGDTLYLSARAIEQGFDLKVAYNGNSNKILAEDDVTDGSLTEIKLNEISINGKPIKGYDPDGKEYEIVNYWGVDTPPVTVIPQEMSAVFDAMVTPDQITVTARSKDGALSTDYVFHIVPYIGLGNIEVQEITESEGSEYFAGASMDGDYTTNCTSDGDDKWIVFDFGEEKNVAAVGVAPYIGTTRQAKFDFLISNDGENWTEVYSGGSSGTTDWLEYYDMKQSRARYVKMLCHGNTTNMKNSFYEICFFDTDQFVKDLHLTVERSQMKAGETQPAKLDGTMFTGAAVDFASGKLTLESSDPAVAAIDNDGNVTAVGNGEATLRAVFTISGLTARAETEISVTDGTYLNETFEEYRDGGGLDRPWSATYGDVSNQVSAATLADGKKVMKITATTASIYPNATYALGKSGKMVFEGDIMSDSTDGYKRIQLYDSNGALYSPLLQMTKNGDLVAYDVDKEYTLRTFRKNKWYHYKIDLDLDTQKYDVYIDGKLYGKDLNMRAVEGNGKPYHWDKGIKSLRIDVSAPDGGPINFFVDNLKIYEQPAAAAE